MRSKQGVKLRNSWIHFGNEKIYNSTTIIGLATKKLRISVEVDDDLIEAIIDSNRHNTTREIVEKLHASKTT